MPRHCPIVDPDTIARIKDAHRLSCQSAHNLSKIGNSVTKTGLSPSPTA